MIAEDFFEQALPILCTPMSLTWTEAEGFRLIEVEQSSAPQPDLYEIALTCFITCLSPGLLFNLLVLPFLLLSSSRSSSLRQSCSLHCPLLPSLLHSLSFGLFHIGIQSFHSRLGFHMVLNQCAESTSEGGSSSRCVIVLHIPKRVLNLCH